MKRLLNIPLLALICVAGLAHAENASPTLGQITFVGSICKDLCDTPTSTWLEHVGRRSGLSPIGRSEPSGRGHCAGLGETSSVSMTSIASRTGDAGIITVIYN
ncbi:hypothetical protein HNP29_001786 [Pseudomonas alcaligenes]|jgi:hypothetical protein|uniref:Secreted protein n=1 Tax=Pseudomonas solani TaxID=2731552 RepID=A0AAU7Y413_9PSED|nr:hypothetical protein L682_08255 [Pseudomonas alcaligenes OT 69]MBB4818410.1 hypothetical protein [Pseudomonas alcaligenes]MDN4143943.1 hypothetical protein [Pseudomonas tohonis]